MRKSMKASFVACILILAVAVPVSAQEADPIAVMKSDASLHEKAAASRALARRGGPEAVPVLAPLLLVPDLSHLARNALEPMPCPEAGAALRDALGKVSGRLKVGVIHSLGMRNDEQAVPGIIQALADDDVLVAQAAGRALGKIATPEAVKALEDAAAGASVAVNTQRALYDSLFICAENLIEKGQKDHAIAIYDRLLGVEGVRREIHTAALRGAVLNRDGAQGMPLLAKALTGESDAEFSGALGVLRDFDGGSEVTTALVEALPTLPAERKVLLVQALGRRGDGAAGSALLAEAKAGPVEVRVAALQALVRMGHSPALDLIAQLACGEDAELAKVARDALGHFPGGEGDAAIRAMLKNENVAARQVAVELISQGGLDAPAGLLMEVAKDDADESVRVVALKALKDYAEMEQMPALLARLQAAPSPSEMQAAEEALDALSARQKQTTGDVAIQRAVYGALPDGPSADVTAKVKEIVKSGAVSVDASNVNFGDAAPGVVKQLRVDYMENGALVSQTVREGQTIRMMSAAVPDSVVQPLCAALAKAQGEPKLALLRLLGSTGSRKALAAVRNAAAEGDGDVKETALSVLCGWPSPDALPVLLVLASSATDPASKDLALRGAVRFFTEIAASETEAREHYMRLMSQVAADEKAAVFSGLAQVNHVGALEMALSQYGDASVRAEALQAAVAVATKLGGSPTEDKDFFNGADLTGWEDKGGYWKVEDGVIVGHSAEQVPKTSYLWSGVKVRDFYLAVDVKQEPVTANSGIQFRSKQINEAGDALGYQGDIGQDVWGRIYHQGGRGKLDWNGRAEEAVKPGDWNRLEILAVGPAIWTAINGKLGVACLDAGANNESSGNIAFQMHAGAGQTVRYRIVKLVHDPKVEFVGMTPEQLVGELVIPE
jgi:HEAT repeat protein